MEYIVNITHKNIIPQKYMCIQSSAILMLYVNIICVQIFDEEIIFVNTQIT